ncbi:MAG TPA: zinc-dependent dehydrogenase [Candidatus Ratteibacteria bacterium]|jgi:L-iditol 2-dehydrogenase|uniref:D-arabitol-phosphate dehydrogenase n=1 Tax=candidate division TA06 bacterium ADurb.Bin131 TaxID=1852827 RepID=A0A1V6C413_UNCT6|nr:MAG: D-arabitol-phosphate dehydrogenase [candidate division TA06 bacterium ADurb.Bin131]HON05625.1 zinc-dependent dehydrogenase [bacterium]HPC29158.1 zinc-dependent dehydrogenase [bacterium]HRS06629.1 zinc-dependent dehydrogenase [Candidatus Ratteibacteria bacterium]HRV04758.1 zinc-dependent dehydrogenase [Candidatus Ratteibacteria bacterium]
MPKAALLVNIEDLKIVDREIPQIGKNEILLRVKACAICGTDIKVFHHGHKHIVFPRVTGHELSGVIEKIGEDIKKYKVGDRVTVAPAIPCGECYYCRRGWQSMCDNLKTIGYQFDGGFAEYMVIPEVAIRNGCVNIIPDGLSFDEAALAEPLACVINGQQLSRVEMGDTVLIVGAGPIGCLHAELAKNIGASKVILADVVQNRLDMASFTGAIRVNSKQTDLKKFVADLTDGRMADRVIVAVGTSDAQEQSLELVAKRGSINFFGGLPKESPFSKINTNTLHYGESFITGTHGSSPLHNKLALDFLSAGRFQIDKYISKKIPLEQILEGLREVEEKKVVKIIVNP